MSNKVLNEEVDIYQMPKCDSILTDQEGFEVTIGDLHANAMKLIFLLIKHGIATNVLNDDYQLLVGIYKKQAVDLKAEDLKKFNDILSKIQWKNTVKVRLIGDELADRGSNDYFILKILEQLQQNKVPYEVMISNHGVEFVEALEKKTRFDQSMISIEWHAPSMGNLQKIIDSTLVSNEEVNKIAQNAYLPAVKVVSYTLSADSKEITLYSHAGIDIKTIERLAEKFNVEFTDNTSKELAETIDRINKKFQDDYVKNGKIYALCDRQVMRRAYEDPEVDLTRFPFEQSMWSRMYDKLSRSETHKGFKVNYVHGHDSSERTEKNIYNLDNDLGKYTMHKGNYSVLISSPRETLNLSQENTLIKQELLMQNLLDQLKRIQNKALDFKQRKKPTEEAVANRLCAVINKKIEQFKVKEIDVNKFHDDCIQQINLARPVLEKHRGWKQILGNLALCVAGFAVLYVAAGLVHYAKTGSFLFIKTDSAQKLDKLQDSIENLVVSQKSVRKC